MVTSLRALVDAARRRGIEPTEPPRTVAAIAEACGMTRQHLYHLLAGRKFASGHTVARLAQGLGKPRAVVEKALAASRAAFRGDAPSEPTI